MNTTTLIIRFAIAAIILLLIDWYAFQAVKTVFKSNATARFIYWGISGGILLFLFYIIITFNSNNGPHGEFSNFMGIFVMFLVPKLILILMLLGEDIWRLGEGLVGKATGKEADSFLHSRRKFISQTGLILAAIPFAGILHGIWKGKYNYRVIKKTLSFKDLPDSFDGLTITQISDIHSGSFDNKDKIEYAIDLVNQQKSDLILFTGDLVNNKAEEMEPWINTFSRLKAPMGKYSILGNHDYGDYTAWESDAAKTQNIERLYEIHREIGFNLLLNDSVRLQKSSDHLNLIGVENWGNGSFAKHGDLERASQNVGADDFNILMSHDPSHFDAVVKSFSKKMHLTLSGHTHGMQFGIEIPGFVKWSPVKYRYPKWAGLYEEAGRLLYVNRGFGFLAFPGRVGIWPEITVLELKKA